METKKIIVSDVRTISDGQAIQVNEISHPNTGSSLQIEENRIKQKATLPTKKQFTQDTIDSLVEKYKNYKGSVDFIYAVVECFTLRDNQFLKGFINSTFQNNRIEACTYVEFKKLAAHWNNIAFETLNRGNYDNYGRTMNTVTNFRIIAHYLEHHNLK